ncbi:MAPEG family protein [Myxacorys almedinensis A]|uniref:MAPEG family protein n=2 Tax=Myxacorys TaxID=2056239 RepID=A0A8J7Z2P8_9CYAN|nr:MAPEG family protein [Myxacorys almedinensis A]
MALFGLSVPTILLSAIAATAVLVYLPFVLVAVARVQAGYSQEMMATPRATIDKLPDYGKRATWAHQNSWEAFSLFSVAALMAYVTQQNSAVVAWSAIAFVPIRFFYSVFYVLDIPVLRSLMFALGSTCIITLIGSSITTTLQ